MRCLMSIAFVTLVLILGNTSVNARMVPDWPYDKLWDAADIVVIIEPLKTENNDDKLQIPWDPKGEWQGLTTHFKVHSILKGGPLGGEIVLKHFDLKPSPPSPQTTIHTDGDGFFIHFTSGPLHYDETISKDGKEISRHSLENQTPVFLAFLKKTPAGEFVPVTGQIDPVFSFRDLREILPSWMN